MSILVTGSLAIDHVMVYPGRFREHILPEKVHALDVSFNVPELRSSFGGTAGNIAYHLRLLGEEPILLATAGRDFGPYADWLRRHGVSRDWIVLLDDVATAQCFIITDLGHNQIIAFHEGALGRAHEARLDSVSAPYDLGIVSSNSKRAMVDYARRLRERGVRAAIDPSHALPLFEGPELVELIRGAHLYVVNDYEWTLTQEITGLGEAELIGLVGAAVVTRGERGSTIHEDARATRIPAVRPERVVDPTGCGDAYRAGLLAGLAKGHSLETAGRMGSLLGALKIEQPGPQGLAIEPEALRERFVRELGAVF